MKFEYNKGFSGRIELKPGCSLKIFINYSQQMNRMKNCKKSINLSIFVFELEQNAVGRKNQKF